MVDTSVLLSDALLSFPDQRESSAGLSYSLRCFQVVLLWGVNTTFVSATPVWFHALFVEWQGVAICLSNTAVDYSNSLGLGFDIAIEVDVHHGNCDV